MKNSCIIMKNPQILTTLLIIVLLCFGDMTLSAESMLPQGAIIVPANDWRYQKGTTADSFLHSKEVPDYYIYDGLQSMELRCYPDSVITISMPRKRAACSLPVRFGVYYLPTGKVDDDNNQRAALEPDYTATLYATKTGDNKTYRILDSALVKIISTHTGVTRFVVHEQGKKDVAGSFPNLANYLQTQKAMPKRDVNADSLGKAKPLADNGGVDSVLNASDTLSYDEENVFSKVDQKPSFPGGEQELLKFIIKNFRYPVQSLEMGVQGKVVARFVVNEDGSVGDVQIIQGLDKYCEAETIRLIKLMPRFTPGRKNGKPVKVYFQLPIMFRIG